MPLSPWYDDISLYYLAAVISVCCAFWIYDHGPVCSWTDCSMSFLHAIHMHNCNVYILNKEKLEEWYVKLQQFLICHSLQDQLSLMKVDFLCIPNRVKFWLPSNLKLFILPVLHRNLRLLLLSLSLLADRSFHPCIYISQDSSLHNPLEGGVEGAYFGRSSNGWIKTELFYNNIMWLVFSVCFGRKQPVLLIIDGHID